MNETIRSHLREADPVMQLLVEQYAPEPVMSTHNVFHDLLSCVVEQQIHYRSTRKWFQKTLDAAGLEELSRDNFSIYEQKGLPAIKLSARKYETIARVMEHWEKSKIPDFQALQDPEFRDWLHEIKGIGPWTSDMLLLYTLGRPDIFPRDDFHLRKMMVELYELPEDKKVKQEMDWIAEEWAPYRSTAVLILFAYKKAQRRRK